MINMKKIKIKILKTTTLLCNQTFDVISVEVDLNRDNC